MQSFIVADVRELTSFASFAVQYDLHVSPLLFVQEVIVMVHFTHILVDMFTLRTLGKNFSRRYFEYFSYFFPENRL